ncbi:unnamed protein product, partial [Phaeothamnion confervicola]
MKTQAAVNHIPTGATECSACHASTVNPNGFQTWTQTATHANTTLSCTSCHGTGKTFASVVTIDSKVGHVATNGLDCASCHTQTLFKPAITGANYHATAGQPAAGACLTCHVSGGPGMGQVSGHIPATAACDKCHTSTSTFTAWQMGAIAHGSVLGTTCATCHGAGKSAAFTNATVKTLDSAGVTHIPVNGDCVVCHDPNNFTTFARTWTASNMQHSAVGTGTCANCHGGQAFTGATIRGVPVGHIPVTGDCAMCHNNNNFTSSGFTRTDWPSAMNHAAVSLASCSACHNANGPGNTYPTAVKVLGKGDKVNHVLTTQDCLACHSTTSFKGAALHDATSAGRCGNSGCHDGNTAGVKGKVSGHIASGQC